MIQLVEKGVPFIAFDFKRDFRELVLVNDKLVVFKRGALKINPLAPPPNLDLRVWERVFCDIYAFNYGWLHGSRNMLQEYLHRLYNRMGSRATLFDLYDLVCGEGNVVGRRRDYRDVVMNRLFSTVVNLSDFLSRDRWIEIKDLLDSYVIIEMDGVSRDEQNFLIEVFLAWIYFYRLMNYGGGGLKHVLIFDEAKRIFDATKEIRHSAIQRGIAMFNLIIDEIRGLGEGLIIADQEPTKLTHSIKANTYVKMVGPLGHGADIEDMARAIGLSEDASRAISYLDRGYWIVKLGGRYPLPFVVRTKPLELGVAHNLSDVLIDYHMRTKLNCLTLSRHVDDSLINRFLLDVYSNLGSTARDRIMRLGISVRKYVQLKRRLINMGILDEFRVKIGGRYRKALFITPRGMGILKKYLGSYGVIKIVGHVSAKHLFYAECLRRLFSSLGFDVYVEAGVGSGRVDILCVKGEYKIGVEVYLGSYQPNLKNIMNKASQLYLLYLFLEDKNTGGRCLRSIDGANKVLVCYLDDFLDRYLNLVGPKTSISI